MYWVGTMLQLMPSCAAASAVTGPIAATSVACSRSAAASAAVQLREAPHGRGAGEGDHVDAAIEQHAVDVGLAIALRVDRHRPVGDDLGHLAAAFPEFLADDLAPDVGAREQEPLALDVAGVEQRLDDALGTRFGGNRGPP